MGYKVDWDNEGKTAVITGGGQTVQVTIGDVYFDPETDLMEDGRFTHEKTREFLDEMLKNIYIYKENGSYYFEWNEIPLPEGQTYGIGLDTFFNTPGTGLGHHLSNGDDPWVKKENRLPDGSFKYKLDNKKMSDIRLYKLTISVRNPNSTYPGRKFSALYSLEYNPNTGSSEIIPYNEYGHMLELEPIDKSIVFGPGL